MDSFNWLSPIGVFVLGAIIGSFLNVCIVRIPRGESLVRPRSHCVCGQLIAWYDNIPLFSWLLLGGRARCCGSRIGCRYFIVELLTAALFLASCLSFAPAKAVSGMVLCTILLGAAFIDWEHFIIPRVFSVGGMLAGVGLSIAFPSLHGVADPIPIVASLQSGGQAFLGVLIGTGLLFWIREVASGLLGKEAMGWGDISFIGAIGSFCGWQGAVFAIFGGALIGTLGISLILLVRFVYARFVQGEAGNSANPYAWGQAVPFGPMLALAAGLYFFVLSEAVRAYCCDWLALFADTIGR